MRMQTEAYICKKFANRNKIIKFVITLMRSKGRSMTKKSAQIAFDDVLRQVTEGNEEAFQQLYLHYHDRLFQFARMYLHQQQAAEDVVADLFFQLWKSRGMLGGIENFNAYIYRAVRNSCTNYLLSGYRNRMSGFTQVQLQVCIDPAVPADEAVDFQLLNSALTDAVEQLPERCRIIFKLAKEDGMSHREIAAALDISPSTVEGQLAIAMRRLKAAAAPFLKKI